MLKPLNPVTEFSYWIQTVNDHVCSLELEQRRQCNLFYRIAYLIAKILREFFSLFRFKISPPRIFESLEIFHPN